MLTAIASAISESLCGVLNTHFTFGLAGSTIRPDAAMAIMGVSASATMSIIASEFGVTVEHDPIDFLPGDRGRQQLEGIALGDAERGGRPCRGQGHADINVAARRFR